MKTQEQTQLCEQVSALMDGQLSGAEFDAAAQNASLGEMRESWHAYHVIGDVLRSSELADCRRDALFLERLSGRLKLEAALPAAVKPVAVEIPIPVVVEERVRRSAANDGVFRWKLVAGLASFAAVAAIGWGTLGSLGPRAAGPQMAQSSTPGLTLAETEAPVMLRDARLDELLSEHRQASGASALGNASGFLRNATFEGSGR
ncbi:sigma-E factor negative regulatory protein [Ottowia thiooxydans]|uniref:sigma-E factor negative regulatory protein n=1 Tax=Ottowia thiooxydans TaxID=219182 RepID=UPI00049127DC|nr:sigma-E factor negative regulatory protein [Ottowia thiooxydans]